MKVTWYDLRLRDCVAKGSGGVVLTWASRAALNGHSVQDEATLAKLKLRSKNDLSQSFGLQTHSYSHTTRCALKTLTEF